ncbi:BQ2448_790 [Microbotryum intermedium]|uniref:BQ2448_790 protein n=1 Tax=Microbotryum intermedium TaxID=269621 RepID=A0A238F7E0_9BASI|nr:BQ2448_790 [Microbotryum intermedium]
MSNRSPYSTSTSTSSSSSNRTVPLSSTPTPSRFFTLTTLYPFLLLSLTTSLAINLRSSRNSSATQIAHLKAQISILERTLERIRTTRGGWQGLSEEERKGVEKELRSIGLNGGREGGSEDGGGNAKGDKETSWTEVIFGNKEKRYQPRHAITAETDWEQGKNSGSAACKRKSRQGS